MSEYNPYRKYSSYWWKYWLNLPGDILWFFRRLRLYAPLLWEDNDYDFNAVLRLIRFKLRRLRQHMESHAITAHSEDRVAELARTDVLLRNVINEDSDDEWSMHSLQWHNYEDDNWCLDKCKAPGDECTKAYNASTERIERNWHTLWKYIDENARGWWD